MPAPKKKDFIVSTRSFPESPCDGYTLDEQLEQSGALSGVVSFPIDETAKTVAVDFGYRGRHATTADIIHRGRKLSKRHKQGLKRRSLTEGKIGHMNNEGLMGRRHLKGVKVDACYVILCGIDHNLRLLLNFIKQMLQCPLGSDYSINQQY